MMEKVEILMCEKGMKGVNGFVVDIGEAAIPGSAFHGPCQS